MKLVASSVLLPFLLLGCTYTPIVPRAARLPDISKGQIGISATIRDSVGSIVPVYVAIRNSSEEVYILSASQVTVFDGARGEYAPIPPEEAANQAGGEAALVGAVAGAGAGAAAGTVLGGVVGAIIGSAVGQPGRGAVIGAGTLGGAGAIGGARKSYDRSALATQSQVLAISLRDQVIQAGHIAQGYVFFPRGEYNRLRVLLIEHGETKGRKELFAGIEQLLEAPPPETKD